jgi:hypothetical protein
LNNEILYTDNDKRYLNRYIDYKPESEDFLKANHSKINNNNNHDYNYNDNNIVLPYLPQKFTDVSLFLNK